MIPRILLVGVGAFGRHHARVLLELEKQGVLKFVGAVVKSDASRARIAREFHIPVYRSLTEKLLSSVDAVDIVTPPETHYALASKCLRYCDVFIEKPLATKAKEARALERLASKQGRILEVGHIFRHHPVAKALKSRFGPKGMPERIRGVFINPVHADTGREPSLEMLHLFDIVDFIWPERTHRAISSRKEGRTSVVSVRYTDGCDAIFTLGWEGDAKKRSINFYYPNQKIEGDFLGSKITAFGKGEPATSDHPIDVEPLRIEISSFVQAVSRHPRHRSGNAIKSASLKKGNAEMAARIVEVAERAIPLPTKRPKVAVIGGGIFGASVAAELGSFCDVVLFEKNSALLREGTLINQFRHHFGYHYPRSDETVWDVQRSRADFEAEFKDAISSDAPTYYALAKKGSFVTVEQFDAFCKKHKLPRRGAFPSRDLLAREETSLCIKVPEPSYHHGTLAKLVESRLGALKSVKILYNTTVTGSSLEAGSKKAIRYVRAKGKEKSQKFDFVINATYANINRFIKWMDFEQRPVRVDLAEVLIVKLPIPPVSITVIDGPFATLMPTGNPNEFTLYHVRESILDRYVPKDGLVREVRGKKSRQEHIYRESLKFFPILKKAAIVESRIVHRGVQAYHEHDDARVADLIEHGFGCWSILSGKILSSVTTAKRVRKAIESSIAP